MGSKAAALATAPAVAAKIENQFGENLGDNALYYVAAVLYEQEQDSITFNQLRKVFESEVSGAFTRPTLRRYRGLVNDLDKPEAVLQRLEKACLHYGATLQPPTCRT